MGGLHRLPGYGDQACAQLVYVPFTAQCRAERFHSLGSIILAAIEAAVDDLLRAPSQRMEEGRNHQCRNDRHRRRLWLAGEGMKKLLQQHHEAQVDTSECDRECPVDQRAVDEDIDIPQAVAQDCDAKAQWSKEEDDAE